VFQIRIMPRWLQAITYVVPNRYFLVVLRGIILKGEPLATYWRDVWALVAYGVVVTALASLRLVRREG
jgi:ABC-2 type transport system permease protein